MREFTTKENFKRDIAKLKSLATLKYIKKCPLLFKQCDFTVTEETHKVKVVPGYSPSPDDGYTIFQSKKGSEENPAEYYLKSNNRVECIFTVAFKGEIEIKVIKGYSRYVSYIIGALILRAIEVYRKEEIHSIYMEGSLPNKQTDPPIPGIKHVHTKSGILFKL